MKRIINLAAIAALAFAFASCEKVIDVDLNTTAKKYVIEGILTDVAGKNSVKITQTKNFDEDNNFPGVAGAFVTIYDNDVPVQLTNAGNGVYSNAQFKGVPGRTYKLEVKLGNETFTAQSIMPGKVKFDTLFMKDEEFFGETRKIPNIQYVDPSGKGNNYRFVLYRNQKIEKPIYLMNDDYANDRLATWQLVNYEEEDDEDKVKKGDIITVDMYCIDSSVYKFWYSVNAASGGSSGSTPANPVTNISGGALGYFSAHTYERKEVTVQ